MRRALPILVGAGLFLALWIVIPGPTPFFLALSVVVRELAPWLLIVNVVLLAATMHVRIHSRWTGTLHAIALCAVLLPLLPIARVGDTEQALDREMRRALGRAYDDRLSPAGRSRMRDAPFSLLDALTGVPRAHLPHPQTVTFAAIDGVPLHMIVYRPGERGLHAAVLQIYGGAWQRGEPADNEAFSAYLAGRGYVVLATDYRHAPRYRFPAQLDDVSAALDYIHRHAAELSVDTMRLALLGRSSGAHLALMSAYIATAPRVRAVIDIYGPVDLREGWLRVPRPDPIGVRSVLETFLGGTPDSLPQRYAAASPVNLVRPALPPTLLIYGGSDHVVLPSFGRELADRLRAAGDTAALLEIPDAEHGFDYFLSGVHGQLALYHIERFLAWALR